MVVEYGPLDSDPAQLEPSSATNYPPRLLFNATSVPQTAIGNRQGTVYAASVVGGGSTVNGMLFDRASADDYDNWEKLGTLAGDSITYFLTSRRYVLFEMNRS